MDMLLGHTVLFCFAFQQLSCQETKETHLRCHSKCLRKEIFELGVFLPFKNFFQKYFHLIALLK